MSGARPAPGSRRHVGQSGGPSRRRALLGAVGAGALLATAGCVNVDLGADPGASAAQFVLLDRTASPTPARPLVQAAALVIQAEAGDPLADSLTMAYARRAGERAAYQLATWSDRPARRLPQLLVRRFEARGSFAAVALLGQPLAADWLLTVAIDEIVHDLTTEPGQARLTVRAALYDRRARRQVAQQTLRVQRPVGELRPAAYAAAMSDAVTRLLDELVPWTEAQIGAGRGTVPPRTGDARP